MTGLLSAFVLASALAAPTGLSAPGLCPTAPAAVERAQLGGGGVIGTTVFCSVDCGMFAADVSCSGDTCNAVERSCPGEPGHVTCDGVTYYCTPCCTEGTFRNVTTGPICSCPDGQTTPKDRYKCVNGDWEYQFSFCGGPFCQG